MGIKGQTPLLPHSFILLFEEERKDRDEMRVEGGGGNQYSPSTSDGYNFHIGAPIDTLFAATRSLLPPLRFYP
ncbi:hypothetical protein PIB30_102340, partial [Stylosanthes scabra]|nr:hypothetical protein [Stylosanthes scabra]